MVYQHSIPFGAPSQLRLLVAPDNQGIAHLSVLDAFNQPIGNLKDMVVPMNQLRALVESDTAVVEATSPSAACVIRLADDPRHEDLEVHYEDKVASRSKTATVTLEDFAALLDQLVKE